MSESAKKSDRFQLLMPPSLIDAIDSWRRRQPAIPSRGEAVRYLVQKGLDAEAVEAPPDRREA